MDFEQIAERAYALWEANGRPDGRDQDFWYAAETELRDQGEIKQLADDDEIVPPLAGLPVH